VALFWPRFRGLSWAQWRQGLGWHTGRGWLREVGAGIVGYLTGLPILALGMVVTMVLAAFSRTAPYHPILDDAGRAGVWSALQIALIASVWAPLIEETMFRGALYHHLRQRGGWLASAVVIGLLFALVHPQGWTAVPALAALGGMFAAIREWRGSIIACMTAHSLHNGVMVAALLLMLR
jgi:membrane protease YdiL (CAAX protease family)